MKGNSGSMLKRREIIEIHNDLTSIKQSQSQNVPHFVIEKYTRLAEQQEQKTTSYFLLSTLLFNQLLVYDI